jgi:hypothetical protein
LGLSFLLVLALSTKLTYALCVEAEEEGIWHNIDPNTREITQAEVHIGCNDLRICDAETGRCPSVKSAGSIELWGQCHPSDCYWGMIPGERRQHDGAQWLVGIYTFGWKTAHVWLRTYDFSGEKYLRVWVWNDYHDGRTDRAFDGWFLP